MGPPRSGPRRSKHEPSSRSSSRIHSSFIDRSAGIKLRRALIRPSSPFRALPQTVQHDSLSARSTHSGVDCILWGLLPRAGPRPTRVRPAHPRLVSRSAVRRDSTRGLATATTDHCASAPSGRGISAAGCRRPPSLGRLPAIPWLASPRTWSRPSWLASPWARSLASLTWSAPPVLQALRSGV